MNTHFSHLTIHTKKHIKKTSLGSPITEEADLSFNDKYFIWEV